MAAVNEKYPQHVHEDLKKKFAHEFSRTDATGQSTFDWDEESHPRDDAGRFADKLHHQIKNYLMNGGQFGLPDIHNHTGHTDHDALDPLANPTTRALKSLVDADAISRTGPEHHNVRFYLTDEQREQHEASGVASEKRDAKSDAKSEEKAQAGPAGLTKREAIAKASANKSGDKGLSHDEMVHATYLYTGTAPQDWSAVAVKGMKEVEGDKGEGVTVPEFEMPSGYKPVPVVWDGGPQSACCGLCGHDIKNIYYIQNDAEKWTMGVGSECVTKFGEGDSGERLVKKAAWAANRDFLSSVWDTYDTLGHRFGDTDKHGQHHTHLGSSAPFWKIMAESGAKNHNEIAPAQRREFESAAAKINTVYGQLKKLLYNSAGAPVTHAGKKIMSRNYIDATRGYKDSAAHYDASKDAAITAWTKRNAEEARKLIGEVDEILRSLPESKKAEKPQSFSRDDESPTLFHVTKKGVGDIIRREGFKPGAAQSELGPGVYLAKGEERFPSHLKRHSSGETYETETVTAKLHPEAKLFPLDSNSPNTPLAIYKHLYPKDYGARYDSDSHPSAGKIYTPQLKVNWPHLHGLLQGAGYHGIERSARYGDVGNSDMVVFDPSHVRPMPQAQSFSRDDDFGPVELFGDSEEFGPVEFSGWNPDDHPRGQPENAGQFAKSHAAVIAAEQHLADGKRLGVSRIELAQRSRTVREAHGSHFSLHSAMHANPRHGSVSLDTNPLSSDYSSGGQVMAAWSKIMGGGTSPLDAGRLVGAKENSTTTISVNKRGTEVTVKTSSSEMSATYQFFRDNSGRLACHMESFFVNPTRKSSGVGLKVFSRVASEMAAAGCAYIDCHAARKNTDPTGKEMDGYSFWPAVGFDMLLDDKDGILEGDESVFSAAKQAFPHAASMLDIFDTKGGPEWWKTNGTDLLKARFLLQDGSRSWKDLTSRVRNRIARRRSELISTSSFREDYRPFLKGATTARNTWPHSATEMSRDDYFGPVEFARKPAKGQVAFDFESPVESHLADAPGENVGTKQDQLFDVQESDVPPEHHEEAKALSEKHGGGEVRRLKNGDWQLRAPVGGKVSEVNGVFYIGGRFMPIHGIDSQAAKKLKPKREKSKGDLFTPPKPNENGRQREQRQEMTPDEIAAEKERREEQRQWNEIARGPLGRLLDLGDKPRYGQRATPILDEWMSFAEKIGKDGVEKLHKSLEADAHEQIDALWKSMMDDQAGLSLDEIARKTGMSIPRRFTEADAEWDKNALRERADRWISDRPRLYKAHEKLVPGSHRVRELLSALMEDEYKQDKEGLIPRLKKYSDMLAALVPAPLVDVAEARQHGYFGNKFDGRTAEGKKVKAGDGWVKKNADGKYETFTDEQVRDAIKPAEFSRSFDSIGPVEFSDQKRETSFHDGKKPGQFAPEDAMNWSDHKKLQHLEESETVEIPESGLTATSGDKERKDAAKLLYRKLTGKVPVNVATGRTVKFTMGGFDKIQSHSKDANIFAILQSLPRLLEVATPIAKEKNTNPKQPNIKFYHNFAAKAEIKGVEYYVRLVVKEQTDGSFKYDHDVTSAEMMRGLPGSPHPDKLNSDASKPLNKYRLLNWYRQVKQKTADDTEATAFSRPLLDFGPVEFGRSPLPGQRELPFDAVKSKRPQIETAHDGTRQVDIPETRTNAPFRATLKTGKTDGLTHFVTLDHAGKDWSKFRAPTQHVERFLDELHGHLGHPANSGHKTLDHVLSGGGKYIGKGNDNAVYDAGNGTVVKAAVITPYHEGNGLRSPDAANAIIDDSVKATKHLRSKGVLGILPQYGVQHDGRSFAVMPKVDVESPLTDKHIQQIHHTLKGMHEAGYVLKDQIQAGLDHNGNAAIYDVGSVRPHDAQKRFADEDRRDDFNSLKHLAAKHGVKYTTPQHKDYADVYDRTLHEVSKAESMDPKQARAARLKLHGYKSYIDNTDPLVSDFYAGAHADAMEKLGRWAQLPPSTVQMSRQPATGQGGENDFGPVEFSQWDSSKHPRDSKGVPSGGEFHDQTKFTPVAIHGVNEVEVSRIDEKAENSRDAMQEMIHRLTGEFTNRNTGITIKVYRDGIRHSLQRGAKDFRVVTALQHLIENSILFATEEHKHADGRFGDVLRFYSPLVIGDESYLASLVVKKFSPSGQPSLEDLRLHHAGAKKSKRLAANQGDSDSASGVTRDGKPQGKLTSEAVVLPLGNVSGASERPSVSIGTPVVFRQISTGGKESREPQFTAFIGTRTNTRNERCGNSHSANVPTGTPKYADNRRKWSRVKRRLPWITAESVELAMPNSAAACCCVTHFSSHRVRNVSPSGAASMGCCSSSAASTRSPRTSRKACSHASSFGRSISSSTRAMAASRSFVDVSGRSGNRSSSDQYAADGVPPRTSAFLIAGLVLVVMALPS